MWKNPKDELAAIGAFFEDMKTHQAAKNRLYKKAEAYPERVLEYLDSLPDNLESGDEVLSRLRRVALAAISSKTVDSDG